MQIKKVSLDESGKVIQEPPRERKTSPSVIRKPSPKVAKAAGFDKIVRVNHLPAPRTNREEAGVNGHWQFDMPLCADNQFGFVYLIHDTINDRMYIGKKQFKGIGILNSGKESNWKWYNSSSEQLKKLIRINTSAAFKFYVLEEYYFRGTLGFAESWSLMQVEAPVNRGKWYNALIGEVSWFVKEPITKKHKERLAMIVAGRADELKVWSEHD